MKILITCAGSTHGINIIKALRKQDDFNLFIIAADAEELAAGFFFADKSYVLPKFTDDSFLKRILEICEDEQINAIIPTFSRELPIFAANKKLFGERKIKMLIPSVEALEKSEDKLIANTIFEKAGVPFCRIYGESEKIEFPVIVKPRKGAGSKNTYRVNSQDELDFFKKYVPDCIIQEFAQGQERVIDGVCYPNHEIAAACARERLETRGGMAVKGITIRDDEAMEYAKKIVKAFEAVGPFNIQYFFDGKNYKFIEINLRYPSGGMPLACAAGVNMPLIALKIMNGHKIEKPNINYGAYMTRYYDAVCAKKEFKIL